MKKFIPLRNLTILVTFVFLSFSCKKDNLIQSEMPDALDNLRVSINQPFYALTGSNELISYTAGNQLTEKSVMPITGIATNETILAIDFRPATGQLYAVSNLSKIYTINLGTGLASAVSSMPFTPSIAGSNIGFDFNPTVDRIRLVTDTGQNLRLNPETGQVVAVDANITLTTARVGGAAYTNSFAGAATTTLYDIDVASDKLYIQNPPNNGALVEVGLLGIQAVGEVGFDISPDNSVAIAAIFGRGYEAGQKEESNGNKMRFYTIDLTTGEAKNFGKTDRKITGIAIPTNPVAYAVDELNRLLIMNLTNGSIITKNIAGLASGDVVAGIDMRPATSQLYALGINSRLYTINLASGMATAVGTAPFETALNGTSVMLNLN